MKGRESDPVFILALAHATGCTRLAPPARAASALMPVGSNRLMKARPFMLSSSKQRFLVTAAACSFIAGAVGLASSSAMNMQADAAQADAPAQVATYKPQQAFDQYYLADQLQQKMQEMQRQMQQAQQAGDRQKLMQIQQQMQQERQKVIDQFYSDVETAAVDVARDEGVDIVAVEILYTADRIGEPADMTEQIIKTMNQNAPQRQGGAAPQPKGNPGR